ncbi:MAG: hypothetical protein GY874_22095 [Desulfobacteraceae bacterium]|nr:hypothetical protein [Desulfobacteraceae bacterium]
MAIDQTYLNKIAKICFRDTADEDYISARSSYRIGLVEPYLWSSLHAIEKYFKAILLFNGLSARYIDQTKNEKEYSHDLLTLLETIKKVEIFEIKLPDWADKYFSYLKEFGINRYLTKDTFTFGRELRHLDEIIWSIRRYCQPPNTFIESNQIEHNPNRLRLYGGKLEKLINGDKNNSARQVLIWKNLYFGKVNRRKVTYKPLKKYIKTPIQVQQGTIEYEELSNYIRI